MSDKKCMVFETLGKVSDLQISEGNNNNEVRLSGVFGVCGVKNQNNRIYDKDNYRAMVESLQQVIATEGCPGELEHPNSMNINLENVSHKIESIEIDENGTVTGTILLLNTPKGQIAKAIVEGGLPLFISSRGAGTITNEGRVTLSNIKTYDLVGTPGFAQAKLSLKENQTLECLNESLDENGNSTWVIIDESQINEGDDLLGLEDDDKKDDKKDSKEEKSEDKDSKKEEKSDDKKEEKSDDKEDEKSEDDKKEEKDNNKDIKDKVTMNELKEAIDKLSDKVTSLEAQLHVAQESLASAEETIAQMESVNYDAIERWVKEEFAPEFKEEVSDEITESVMESVEETINETTQAIAEGVQNWCTNEFAPVVEGWVTNEFAPVVEGWVTDEFAPVVEGWINDEFTPVMEGKVNAKVDAILESQKAGRLDEIDALLESIAESTDVEKIVKEEKEVSKFKGIYVVEHMPSQYAPSWQMLNEERQNEIIRSSKMYDFTKEGVLESFWASVDFNNRKEETNKVVNVVESYHNNVAAQMKRFGKW